jgi:hypothetical protein
MRNFRKFENKTFKNNRQIDGKKLPPEWGRKFRDSFKNV